MKHRLPEVLLLGGCFEKRWGGIGVNEGQGWGQHFAEGSRWGSNERRVCFVGVGWGGSGQALPCILVRAEVWVSVCVGRV